MSEKAHPAISIIIPSYNRKDLSLRAIRSALLQTFTSNEIIFIDDGSSESYEEIKHLLEINQHHYIKINHGGVSSARNEGIRHARAEWIAFLDSDDVWHEDKLELQYQYAEMNPKAKIIQCREKWFKNNRLVNIPKHLQPASGDAFERSLDLCCISPSATMLKKTLIDQVGLFDETLRVCEDYDYWLRILATEPVHLLDAELIDRHSGSHEQLSTLEEANDRFRVYSLFKFIASASHSSKHKLLALKSLRSKLEILKSGAEKRFLKSDVEIYCELYKSLSLDDLILLDECGFQYWDSLLSRCKVVLDYRPVRSL